jgi:hypothetical protein
MLLRNQAYYCQLTINAKKIHTVTRTASPICRPDNIDHHEDFPTPHLPICQLFTIPGETGPSSVLQYPGSTMSARLTAILTLVAGLAAPVAPFAAEDGAISVNANMARVLRLSAPAATVIIGNPGIADVTIQDPRTLILTGKNYGQTNLIVLDGAGAPIADTLIEVVQLQADTMTIYQGLERETVTCSPVCQPTVMLGDNPGFTSEVIASSQLIENLASQ